MPVTRNAAPRAAGRARAFMPRLSAACATGVRRRRLSNCPPRGGLALPALDDLTERPGIRDRADGQHHAALLDIEEPAAPFVDPARFAEPRTGQGELCLGRDL